MPRFISEGSSGEDVSGRGNTDVENYIMIFLRISGFFLQKINQPSLELIFSGRSVESVQQPLLRSRFRHAFWSNNIANTFRGADASVFYLRNPEGPTLTVFYCFLPI